MADKSNKKNPRGTDLRKYSSQTNFRLVLWFIFMILFIGLGLVWLIYGRNAALLGFLCLLGTGIPVALIAIFIFGLDKLVKRSD